MSNSVEQKNIDYLYCLIPSWNSNPLLIDQGKNSPTIISLHFSGKVPSSFCGYGGYQEYCEDTILSNALTLIFTVRRPLPITSQLTKKSPNQDKNGTGSQLDIWIKMGSLIRDIDRKFWLQTGTVLHNDILDFFNIIWDKNVSVEEFVAGFHSRLDIVSLLKIKKVLKTLLLIKLVDLDSQNRNLVIGETLEDLFLQSLPADYVTLSEWKLSQLHP